MTIYKHIWFLYIQNVYLILPNRKLLNFAIENASYGKHIFFLDSFGNFTLSFRFKCKYTHLTVENIYIEHSSYDFTKDKFVKNWKQDVIKFSSNLSNQSVLTDLK